MNINQELRKRDAAISLLKEHRQALIDVAFEVALNLARKNKTVTSTQVIEELKLKGFESYLSKYDKRFMGAVFRDKIWTRAGFENSGSHGRHVSVWRLK